MTKCSEEYTIRQVVEFLDYDQGQLERITAPAYAKWKMHSRDCEGCRRVVELSDALGWMQRDLAAEPDACNAFTIDDIDRYLSGRCDSDLAERILRHVAECKSCKAFIDGYQRLYSSPVTTLKDLIDQVRDTSNPETLLSYLKCALDVLAPRAPEMVLVSASSPISTPILAVAPIATRRTLEDSFVWTAYQPVDKDKVADRYELELFDSESAEDSSFSLTIDAQIHRGPRVEVPFKEIIRSAEAELVIDRTYYWSVKVFGQFNNELGSTARISFIFVSSPQFCDFRKKATRLVDGAPTVAINPSDLLMQIEGAIYFAAAERFEDSLEHLENCAADRNKALAATAVSICRGWIDKATRSQDKDAIAPTLQYWTDLVPHLA